MHYLAYQNDFVVRASVPMANVVSFSGGFPLVCPNKTSLGRGRGSRGLK